VKGTTKHNIKARINIALSCHCKNIEFVESWQIEASSSSFFFSLLLSHTCFSLSSILSLLLTKDQTFFSLLILRYVVFLYFSSYFHFLRHIKNVFFLFFF
jgi:hypothetical protein